jgi:hypothetical protein
MPLSFIEPHIVHVVFCPSTTHGKTAMAWPLSSLIFSETPRSSPTILESGHALQEYSCFVDFKFGDHHERKDAKFVWYARGVFGEI